MPAGAQNLSCDGVCFPLALLYDKEYNFVGYLMRQAHGRELQRCVFQPQLLKGISRTGPSRTR